jgi:Na+-driven multidrug efflux pump
MKNKCTQTAKGYVSTFLEEVSETLVVVAFRRIIIMLDQSLTRITYMLQVITSQHPISGRKNSAEKHLSSSVMLAILFQIISFIEIPKNHFVIGVVGCLDRCQSCLRQGVEISSFKSRSELCIF